MNKFYHRIITIGLILVLCSLSMLSCTLNKESKPEPSDTVSGQMGTSSYQDVMGEAKIPLYTSKQEIIDNSELVIIGKKLGEEQVSFAIENGITDDFTKSTVEVLKLIKTMPGKDIGLGSKIVVLEQEWIDDKQQQIIHMAGYKKMKTGSVYALYLGYNKQPDSFYPVGCIYGKIPVDAAEQILFQEKEGDFSNILSVLRDLYIDYSGD